MRFDTKMRATITMDGGVIFLREFAQRMRVGVGSSMLLYFVNKMFTT